MPEKFHHQEQKNVPIEEATVMMKINSFYTANYYRPITEKLRFLSLNKLRVNRYLIIARNTSQNNSSRDK